jgi:hypothetical protein
MAKRWKLGIGIEASAISIPASQSGTGLGSLLLRYRIGFGIGTNFHSVGGHVVKKNKKPSVLHGSEDARHWIGLLQYNPSTLPYLDEMAFLVVFYFFFTFILGVNMIDSTNLQVK